MSTKVGALNPVYYTKVCPNNPTTTFKPTLQNMSFEECRLNCIQQDNCSLFDFRPNKDNDLGSCGHFRPMEKLVKNKDNNNNSIACGDTYQINPSSQVYAPYTVKVGGRNIQALPQTLDNYKSARSFEVLSGDVNEACQQACFKNYECFGYSVDKANNRCLLKYGGPSNYMDMVGTEMVSVPPSVIVNSRDMVFGENRNDCQYKNYDIYNSKKMNFGYVIDDPNHCKEVADNFKGKLETTNRNDRHYADGSIGIDFLKKEYTNGLDYNPTDNPGVPYGCILAQYDNIHSIFFNKNKKNTRSTTNTPICTMNNSESDLFFKQKQYFPRNKYVVDVYGKNTCSKGGSKILNEETCKLAGESMGLAYSYGTTTSNDVPYGCIAYKGDDTTNTTNIYFNKNKNTNTNATYRNNAMVCDMFPDIKSKDFQPVLKPDPKKGISSTTQVDKVLKDYEKNGFETKKITTILNPYFYDPTLKGQSLAKGYIYNHENGIYLKNTERPFNKDVQRTSGYLIPTFTS